jgi:hypothetical protein
MNLKFVLLKRKKCEEKFEKLRNYINSNNKIIIDITNTIMKIKLKTLEKLYSIT